MVPEHEQSSDDDACRGCSICVYAVPDHSRAHSVGGLHEAYATKEEEQWEAGEEVEGVVATDPRCSRTALEASWLQKMEVEAKIEIMTHVNNCYIALYISNFSGIRNVDIVQTSWQNLKRNITDISSQREDWTWS